jgi:hypothetical protein
VSMNETQHGRSGQRWGNLTLLVGGGAKRSKLADTP